MYIIIVAFKCKFRVEVFSTFVTGPSYLFMHHFNVKLHIFFVMVKSLPTNRAWMPIFVARSLRFINGPSRLDVLFHPVF